MHAGTATIRTRPSNIRLSSSILNCCKWHGKKELSNRRCISKRKNRLTYQRRMCGATYAALWNPYQYGHRRLLERACSYKLGISSSVDSTRGNAAEALMPRIHCYFLLLLFPFSALAQVPVPVTSAPNVTTTPKAPNTASAALAAIPQEKQNGRPRIGVALEGGGALGLAHIGVLEWFE